MGIQRYSIIYSSKTGNTKKLAEKIRVTGVAAHQHALVLLQILGADLQAQRHALHFPLGELPAGGVVAVIQLHAGVLADLLGQLGSLLGDAGLVGGDGHHNHLDGGDGRGQDQAVVVAVGHDDGTHQTGGNAPAGLERMMQLVVASSPTTAVPYSLRIISSIEYVASCL